ncbi:unnamed protein product, partial [Brenthis ino]
MRFGRSSVAAATRERDDMMQHVTVQAAGSVGVPSGRKHSTRHTHTTSVRPAYRARSARVPTCPPHTSPLHLRSTAPPLRLHLNVPMNRICDDRKF